MDKSFPRRIESVFGGAADTDCRVSHGVFPVLCNEFISDRLTDLLQLPIGEPCLGLECAGAEPCHTPSVAHYCAP